MRYHSLCAIIGLCVIIIFIIDATIIIIVFINNTIIAILAVIINFLPLPHGTFICVKG